MKTIYLKSILISIAFLFTYSCQGDDSERIDSKPLQLDFLIRGIWEVDGQDDFYRFVDFTSDSIFKFYSWICNKYDRKDVKLELVTVEGAYEYDNFAISFPTYNQVYEREFPGSLADVESQYNYSLADYYSLADDLDSTSTISPFAINPTIVLQDWNIVELSSSKLIIRTQVGKYSFKRR